MEFRQLTYFLAASQTQNFRKAADLCLVAQSALSRQIAALEAELGVALFQRIERRVILTEAGQEFAKYARTALEQLQQGQQAMIDLKTGEHGTVAIGCVEALATTFLPGVVAGFNKRHPNIRLQVSVGGADQLMRQVEQGTLDFGLILDPSSHSQLIAVRELFRQPLQLVLSMQHPLAQSGSTDLKLEQVAREPVVILREGFGLRRIMSEIFARRGLELRPVVEIDSVEAMKEFVKHGVGVTLMPVALIRPDQINRELAVLPVADLSEEFTFALVYRRTGSLPMAARGLLETIAKAITP